MTREEFRAKWSARRAEWEKLGVLVRGRKVWEAFILDFEDVWKCPGSKQSRIDLNYRNMASEQADGTV